MLNSIKKNGFEYLVYGLILSLFFSKAIPNIILAILSLWILKDFKSLKNQKFAFSSTSILVVLLLFLTVKSILFANIAFDFRVYKGIFLSLWGFFVFRKVKDINKLKFFVLWGINAAIVSSLFLIALFFFKTNTLPFSNTGEVNELLILERPYIGFIAVLGFFLAIERAFLFDQFKKLWLINAAFLFLFIILISARISIITLFVAAGIYLLFYFRMNRYKKAAVLLSLIFAFGLIVFTNKNISERFFIKNNLEESLKTASDYEPRIVIWNCAYQMTKNADFNVFIGFDGYHTISNYFLDCYATTIENQSKKEYFLTEKFNSHNQFIDFYLIGGLIAFGLFLAFFITLLFEVKAEFFKIAIVISFLLFFIVEDIFYRQFGCYLFGIFTLILSRKTSNE